MAKKKAKRKEAGRPRALADPVKREELLKVLRVFGSRTDASAKVGVAYNTLQAELKRDPKFAEAVVEAELSAKLGCIARIVKAGAEDWRAAQFMLERKYFREFGKRSPDSITVRDITVWINGLAKDLATVIPSDYFKPMMDVIETWVKRIMTQEGFENGE